MTPHNEDGFGQSMREHLRSVEAHNASSLDEVATLLYKVLERDGLIYAGGAGHSVALILETFYRAGGLACVYPLFHPALFPLFGGRASTALERVSGLASTLLEDVSSGSSDAGFVFSNSGVNQFPVELAQGLRQSGTPVVAVTSLPHMEKAPARSGVKLVETADHVIDTLVPYGDASHEAAPNAAPTAALSSLTSVFCWNLLLSRLADRAAKSGMDLPLWTSANVAGGDERNATLVERYRPRLPGLL